MKPKNYKLNVYEDSFNVDRISFTDKDVCIIRYRESDTHTCVMLSGAIKHFADKNFRTENGGKGDK